MAHIELQGHGLFSLVDVVILDGLVDVFDFVRPVMVSQVPGCVEILMLTPF